MADATETPKVITEHAEANEAIGLLRDIAKALKACGDENVELDKRIASQQERIDKLEQDALANVNANTVLDGWREVIEDYGRGILDRAELFDRTIGREHD